MDERQALEDAWEHFAQNSPQFRRWACSIIDDRGTTQAGRFTAMLDAGAYLDAAMMLVPAGWGWRIEWEDHHSIPASAVVYRPDPTDRHYVEPIVCDGAPTPSAALLSAILAARRRIHER